MFDRWDPEARGGVMSLSTVDGFEYWRSWAFCLGYPVGDAVLGVHVPVVGNWGVIVFCHRVQAEGVWKELERRVYAIRRELGLNHKDGD